MSSRGGMCDLFAVSSVEEPLLYTRGRASLQESEDGRVLQVKDTLRQCEPIKSAKIGLTVTKALYVRKCALQVCGRYGDPGRRLEKMFRRWGRRRPSLSRADAGDARVERQAAEKNKKGCGTPQIMKVNSFDPLQGGA